LQPSQHVPVEHTHEQEPVGLQVESPAAHVSVDVQSSTTVGVVHASEPSHAALAPEQ
jgi:hypothetical protein